MPDLEQSKISDFLHIKATREKIPLTGTFELTPVCNMDCRMCYVRMSKAEQEAVAPLRTAVEWLQLAEECKKAGMVFLLLTGGEIFLRPDFKQILSGLSKMGFYISLNTNGTLITEEIVQWMRSNAPCRINMTLYGASDETYARLCGNPKGFTQAIHALDLLQDAGFSVKINLSMSPYNREDTAAMVDLCKARKLKIQYSSYMFPPTRKTNWVTGQNDRFSPYEAAENEAEIMDRIHGREALLRYIKENKDMLPPEPDCMEQGEGTGVLCRAGRCSFWVTWKGDFLPCGMFPTEGAPNVFELGINKCWKQTVEWVEGIRLAPGCVGCKAFQSCQPCAAKCYAETGRFEGLPEYRCEMFRAYPKVFQKMLEEAKQSE